MASTTKATGLPPLRIDSHLIPALEALLRRVEQALGDHERRPMLRLEETDPTSDTHLIHAAGARVLDAMNESEGLSQAIGQLVFPLYGLLRWWDDCSAVDRKLAATIADSLDRLRSADGVARRPKRGRRTPGSPRQRKSTEEVDALARDAIALYARDPDMNKASAARQVGIAPSRLSPKNLSDEEQAALDEAKRRRADARLDRRGGIEDGIGAHDARRAGRQHRVT